MASVTQSRVEIRCTVQKEGARPNGLHYDPADDQLLIVDQGDGDLITIDDPRGARRESVFQANSGKPSGVVRTDFGGRDTIFMASTYNLALTQVRGDEAVEVDVRGVGTGIVDFAQDLVNGTHTGYHGLEWDGEYLWASSPPGKAIFKMKLEETADGTAVSECSWFPVAFGNRPHGLGRRRQNPDLVQRHHPPRRLSLRRSQRRVSGNPGLAQRRTRQPRHDHCRRTPLVLRGPSLRSHLRSHSALTFIGENYK
jgi:hypothetical protein